MNLKYWSAVLCSRWALQPSPEPFEAIVSRFAPYTMIPSQLYRYNLQLGLKVQNLSGAVVECGVWRGGMIAGLASVLGHQRSYHLFDSFEGLPPAKEIDGAEALLWQQTPEGEYYHNNCRAERVEAEAAMALSGAEDVHFHQGWFEVTLPGFSPAGGIALLRLDADWYDSTMTCLEHLFDQVVPGGLILLDDYYTWTGCSRALHDFLSRRKSTERIRNLGDVCYIQKSYTAATDHA